MLSTKLKLVIIGLGIILIGIFFTMWRITSIKLTNTKEQLTEITCQLDSLVKENTRLVEYNKRRDTQIKQLEQDYQKQLNTIPADICGDTKPSEKLIEFFKQNR